MHRVLKFPVLALCAGNQPDHEDLGRWSIPPAQVQHIAAGHRLAGRDEKEDNVMKLRTTMLAAALIAASVPSTSGTAEAAWRGGWGWGGVGLGLAAGALIGSALAAPYYGYGYGYRPAYYGYGYSPGYYGYAYAPGYSGYGTAPYYNYNNGPWNGGYSGYYASPYYRTYYRPRRYWREW
jgi:hypothetical protein